ncbi:hypothetical protein [Vibrio parahaemolyticus]|uniref:hypothetical protein n=1 Tax=Vibrio parahaemolyticus TaxID=670 RepID=UPI001D169146|nr:hypothetical protein [Vibrio parahaemolyticus]MCC3836077.1 hypothetical protein [Vibrio parahaemolyticus]
MHKEILMDGSPTYPNAKAAPFRVFDLENLSHWLYLLSGETLWFESVHDMHNFIRGLLDRCFEAFPEMDGIDVFQVCFRFSCTRAMIRYNGLWHVIDVRNCTVVLIKSLDKRADAEELV